MKKIILSLLAVIWFNTLFPQQVPFYTSSGNNNFSPSYDANTSSINTTIGKTGNKQLAATLYNQSNIEKFKFCDSFRTLTRSYPDSIWKFKSRAVCTYDQDGYQTQTKWYNWGKIVHNWINFSTSNQSYNSNHELINAKSELHLYNINDDFYRKQTNESYYYYDSMGRQILYTYYDSVIEKIWRNKCQYIYNSSNDIVQRIDVRWDNNLLQWVNSGNLYFTYDSNGNNLSFLSNKWDTATKGWINSQKFLYFYDIDGNNTQTNYYYWNYILLLWDSTYRFNYIYDACGNRLKGNCFQRDQNNLAFHPYEIYDYNYNCNGQILCYTKIQNSNNLNQWLTYEKVEYSYDNTGNNTLVKYSYWYPSDSTWFEHKREEYYYKQMYSPFVSINNFDKAELQIYPNPANDKITINGMTGKSKVQIFSVDGRLVKSFTTDNKNSEVDISGIPPAVYILKIDLNGQSLYKKFLKE